MKSFIILISILSIAQKSISQDWVYVTSNTEGDKWYIKSSSVQNSGSNGEIIKIWTKKELKKTTVKKNGKTFTYTNAKELQLIEADCSEKKIKFITTTTYNSQGKVVYSFTYEDYEQVWSDVVPDSVGEATLNKICENFH